MELAPDFDDFIGSFTRFTGGLDILVRPALDKAARLLAALEAFGFPVTDLSPD